MINRFGKKSFSEREVKYYLSSYKREGGFMINWVLNALSVGCARQPEVLTYCILYKWIRLSHRINA